MAWQIQIRGAGGIGPAADVPDEVYGADNWGPAFFGAMNPDPDSLSATAASTFNAQESARAAMIALRLVAPGGIEIRMVELP